MYLLSGNSDYIACLFRLTYMPIQAILANNSACFQDNSVSSEPIVDK